MNGEDSKNLIVGRQDGNIEVYVTDMCDSLCITATAFVHVKNIQKWKQPMVLIEIYIFRTAMRVLLQFSVESWVMWVIKKFWFPRTQVEFLASLLNQ